MLNPQVISYNSNLACSSIYLPSHLRISLVSYNITDMHNVNYVNGSGEFPTSRWLRGAT